MTTASTSSLNIASQVSATESSLPPGILRSSSNTAISDSLPSLTSDTSSTPSSSPGISFAPLPLIGRQKKNNTTKLGVSSRTSLLRQRPPYYNHTYGTDVNGKPQAIPYYIRKSALEEENEALDAIGQMISEAGKSLWRRVTRKKSKTSMDNAKTEVATATPDVDEKKTGLGELRDKELRVDKVVQYSLKEEFEDGISDEDLNSGLDLRRNSPSLDSVTSEDADTSLLSKTINCSNFQGNSIRRSNSSIEIKTAR